MKIRDGSDPAPVPAGWWKRKPVPRDHLVTPILSLAAVSVAISTSDLFVIEFVKIITIVIALGGIVILFLRFNLHPDPVPEDWSEAWGQVLKAHCFSALGSLAVIQANIWY